MAQCPAGRFRRLPDKAVHPRPCHPRHHRDLFRQRRLGQDCSDAAVDFGVGHFRAGRESANILFHLLHHAIGAAIGNAPCAAPIS
jgi:hypothetical protein